MVKTYSVQIHDKKGYRQEIGKMVETEDKTYLNLYMFPDQKIEIKQEYDNPRQNL